MSDRISKKIEDLWNDGGRKSLIDDISNESIREVFYGDKNFPAPDMLELNNELDEGISDLESFISIFSNKLFNSFLNAAKSFENEEDLNA